MANVKQKLAGGARVLVKHSPTASTGMIPEIFLLTTRGRRIDSVCLRKPHLSPPPVFVSLSEKLSYQLHSNIPCLVLKSVHAKKKCLDIYI